MMIDSGASVNLLDEITFARINSHGLRGKFKAYKHQNFSYGSETALPPLETFTAIAKSCNASTLARCQRRKWKPSHLVLPYCAEAGGSGGIPVPQHPKNQIWLTFMSTM